MTLHSAAREALVGDWDRVERGREGEREREREGERERERERGREGERERGRGR